MVQYIHGALMILVFLVLVDDPTTETGDERANTLPITVIVLGVLLGIAVLMLIGCLVAFLDYKRRQETQTNNSHQTQVRRGLTLKGLRRSLEDVCQ